MSETAHSHDAPNHAAGHGDHGDGHGTQHYVKVWAILLVLLCCSVAGPFLGIKVVTLLTAFGIAVVKAYMVAKNFMHLNIEKRYIVYLLVTALAFMGLFYAGVSPDIMEHHGKNWVNTAANQETARALAAEAAGSEDENHEGHEGHEKPEGAEPGH